MMLWRPPLRDALLGCVRGRNTSPQSAAPRPVRRNTPSQWWPILLTSVLVTLSPINAQASPQACIYTFGHSPVSKQKVAQDHQTSVLKIFGPTRSGHPGTGYVIDEENGYVITASHVLTKIDKDANEFIGFNKMISSATPILLHKIHALPEDTTDLALLQITNLSDVRSLIKAFDFEVASLAKAEPVFTLGFPQIPGMSRDSADPDIAEGEFARNDSYPERPQFPSDMIFVKQQVWDGHSGSPLVSQRGLAIGTASRGLDDGKVALYFSMAWTLDLMAKIASASELPPVQRLMAYLQKGAVDIDNLANLVMGMRNYDLAIWTLTLPSTIQSVCSTGAGGGCILAKYQRCPLRKAFYDRNMSYFFQIAEDSVINALVAPTLGVGVKIVE